MKPLFKNFTTGLGMALFCALTSCEKDSLLTPAPAGSTPSAAVADISLPSPKTPQVYKLTRHGYDVLTYDNDGRLQKVTTTLGRGLPAHTDYSYNAGSIRAISYKGYVVVRDETFTLDASGRCTKSVVKGVYNDTEWSYIYNAKGQLWSCQNKNSCVGGTSYTYNADGDLTGATVATSPSDGVSIAFAYALPGDTFLYNETYPLNLNVPLLPEHDTYLPIFGKSGKHLVKGVSYSPTGSGTPSVSGNRFYTYVIMPYDGYAAYITERNMTHTVGGPVAEHFEYAYTLTDITVK